MAEISILTKYREYLSSLGKQPKTVDNNVDIARRICRFLTENYDVAPTIDGIAELKGYMLQEWVKLFAAHKESTRRVTFNAARNFVAFLDQGDYVDKDYTAIFPKIKSEITYDDPDLAQSPRVYSNEQIQQLLGVRTGRDYADKRAQGLIVLLALTGMRVSEVASLNLGDIRGCTNNMIVCLRKGGRRQRVAVPDAALEWLKPYMALRENDPDDSPLFATYGKERMTRRLIHKDLAERQKKIGLKTGVHNFRHTFTTNIARSSGLYAAMALDNHASVHMTRKYTHVSDADRIEAVNGLDIVQNFSPTTNI